ncbi:hypothetical protein V5T82_06340 [Magnetovibrio sp. PR-2]|uniref:hypothetical protein n=1 Tax=Magnetovibrio sp. PR-2 TaxID=3120356 RepID=UPI002FCE6347
MSEEPKHISTGESQISINKTWVAIVVVGVCLFVGGVGWMYQVTATARPATVHTGGY